VGVRRVPVPWIVAVRRVPVRRVAVRSVAVEEELAAAGCAHAVRGSGGAFGVGVGGGGGGGLLGCAELSHRAAQPEEEQQGSTELCGRHDTQALVMVPCSGGL
jgi:hypothetical protein